MSFTALQWAFAYDKTESSAERLVLLQFANHADERGYAFPSIEFIASVCHLHRDTVTRAIDALIDRRVIFRTKKRRGSTGQVKVYRMPKSTYESHLKTSTFEKDQSSGKAPAKVGESHLRLGTNHDTDNREPKTSSYSKALGSSLAVSANKQSESSISVSQGHHYQKHPKWPEFVAWCKKVDPNGTPRRQGFDTWLSKQKPQWRNRVKAVSEEIGYVLDGTFYAREVALRLAESRPEVITKFQSATRRNGRIYGASK